METEGKRNEVFILVVIGLVFAIAIVVVLLLFSGKKTYKISFNTQTSTKLDAIEIKKGESFDLPTVTREGYVFKGWYIGDELVDSNYTITKDSVLTAKWEIKEYTITFNTDGGTNIDSVKVKHADTLVLPATPTKSGYTFVSWIDELGNEYKGGEEVVSDMTLKATWKSNSGSSGSKTTSFKVSFNSNGGSNVSAIAVTCGNNLPVLPTPTKSGYTFVSWTDSNGNTVQSGQKLSCNNITLTAKWQSNGGSSNVTPTPKATVVPTTKPTTQPTSIPAPTPTSQTKTTMTITFDPDGGTIANTPNIKSNAITVNCGEALSQLPHAVKSGYALMYWKEKKTGQPLHSGTKWKICTDIQAVAVWYEIPKGPNNGDVYSDINIQEIIENIIAAAEHSL